MLVLSHLRQQRRLCCSAMTILCTGHARRRSKAVANLEPDIDRMANQYNKSSKFHRFKVGQHVGLQIVSEVREKMHPRFVVCMVISKQRHVAAKYAVSMVWFKGSSAPTSWCLGRVSTGSLSLQVMM